MGGVKKPCNALFEGIENTTARPVAPQLEARTRHPCGDRLRVKPQRPGDLRDRQALAIMAVVDPGERQSNVRFHFADAHTSLGPCAKKTRATAIAWIASHYFGIGPIGFVAFFALQCLYLLLWLKRIAWAWLLFCVSGRRKMIAHLEDFLYQQRFPRPPDFITGIDDYFAKIANDNKASPLQV